MANEKKASKRKGEYSLCYFGSKANLPCTGAESAVTDSQTTKRAKLENGTKQPAKKSKTTTGQEEESLPVTKRATRPKATDFMEGKLAEDAGAGKEAASATAVKATKATNSTKDDEEAATNSMSRNTTGKNKGPKKAEPGPKKAQATAKASKAQKPHKAAEEKEEAADEPKTLEKPKAKKGKKSKSNADTAPPQKRDEEFDGFSSDDDAPRNMEETAALLAGFESPSDSSDDDGIAVNKLPAPPKPSKETLAAARQANDNEPESSGVLYIGRVPHGFHELQMRAYFSQFGSVTNLRLARNRRTGASKHYAFIEFDSATVADIVARTMDKYLLFGHILQVRVMPKAQVHAEMWKGANKRFKKIPWGAIEARGLRAKRDRAVWSGRIENEVVRREKKMKVLDEFGYEFDMPKVRRVEDLPTRTRIDDGAAWAGEVPEAIEDVPAAEVSLETTQKRSKRDLAEGAGEAVTTKAKKAKVVKGKKKALKA
jgi:nucleolar protein 15